MKPYQASQQLRKRLSSILSAPAPRRGFAGESGWGISTTRGPQREGNEDRCLLMHIGYAQRPDAGALVAILCDGMGGMQGGDVAAVEAISVFASQVAFTPYLSNEARLTQAAFDADAAVQAKLNGKGGTTLSALFITRNGSALGLNVGDSRIYEMNAERDVIQRSRDDTIGGLLSTGDEPVVGDNRLLQHIGMGRALSPHMIELRRSATYILTSDGAHGIGDRTLKGIIQNAPTPSDVVRRLTYFTDIRGGDDNATAVTVSPREFVEPELPHEGVLCTIWTPFKEIEAWFAIDFPAAPTDTAHRNSDAYDLDSNVKEAAPRSPSKGRKSQRKKKTPLAALPLDGPAKGSERPGGLIEEINDASSMADERPRSVDGEA